MEVAEGRRVCRDQTRMMSCRPMFKKVQVVYYLSRNGHLEHPHYMEVTHLAHQQLRLKDVMDRLRSLRGKAMPSLYSWSCKRSYKNGYVWNDLSENDAIYPSEGAEYVLKGSELVYGCTDKLHSLQLGNNVQHDSNLPKIKSLAFKQYEVQETAQEMEEQEDDDEYEMKASNHVSHARCSRGVSTDEIDQEFKQPKSSELSLDCSSFSSPPSTTSSDTINNNNNPNNNSNNNTSKRFEDGSPVANEPLLSKNSMLLSLIACGGSASFRKAMAAAPPVVAKPSPARKSGSSHKGAGAGAKEDMMMMIGCMSENPRFGSLQAEEKEYFSGSIVESIGNQNGDIHSPGLKKSSSHNEERSKADGLGEAAKEDESEKDNGLKGKCIPRKKTSSKQSRK